MKTLISSLLIFLTNNAICGDVPITIDKPDVISKIVQDLDKTKTNEDFKINCQHSKDILFDAKEKQLFDERRLIIHLNVIENYMGNCENFRSCHCSDNDYTTDKNLAGIN